MVLCSRSESRARRRRKEIALQEQAQAGGALAVNAAAAAAGGDPQRPWTLNGIPVFQYATEEKHLSNVPVNAYGRSGDARSVYNICGVTAVHCKQQSILHAAVTIKSLREYISKEREVNDLYDLPKFMVITWFYRPLLSSDNYAIIHVFRRDDEFVSKLDPDALEKLQNVTLTGDLRKLEFRAELQDAPVTLQQASAVFGLQQPVNITNRLSSSVYRGQGYLEIDHDIGSSTIATFLRGIVTSASGNCAIDTTWSIITNARTHEVVPLASIRWYYTDLQEIIVELDDDLNPLGVQWGGKEVHGEDLGSPLPSDMPGDAWMEKAPNFLNMQDIVVPLDIENPHTVPNNINVEHNTYSEPNVDDLVVRGPGYLCGAEISNRSLKISSQHPFYTIAGANAYKSKSQLTHVAAKIATLKSFLAQYHDPPGVCEFPMFLVVSWVFKSVWTGEFTAVVHVFRRNDALIESLSPGVRSAFSSFVHGNERTRVDRLKLIAKIRGGSPSFRKTVESLNAERPVIIAKKLKTHFFEGKNYLEYDHDVGSSTTASILNSTVLKASTTLIIDTTWVVEAKHESELPEHIFCAVRWNYVDLNASIVALDKDYNPV